MDQGTLLPAVRGLLRVSMPVLLLPDLLAIVLMTAALAEAGRRFKDQQAKLWTAGSILIVLETQAHLLYTMAMPALWHRTLHAVALVSFVAAGGLFLRSAVPSLLRMPRSWPYFSASMAAPVLLMATYGMNWEMSGPQRLLAAVAGAALGLGAAWVLKRPWHDYLAISLFYLPALLAARFLQPRQAVYLMLAVLYITIARCFAANSSKESRARFLIAAGFALWALTFATHPWVALLGPTAEQLANQIWTMHKFAVTIGFVFMLLERQVQDNQWLALHDQLTGLPNRRLYEDRLAGALERAKRYGSSILLFTMDLDGLKTVNDQLGHDAGDALLRQVVAHMNRVVRSTDTLARLGGDEFSLLAVDIGDARRHGGSAGRRRSGDPRLWPPSPPEFGASEHMFGNGSIRPTFASIERETLLRSAWRIERDLRAAVEEPMHFDRRGERHELRISTSVGMAIYPDDTTDVQELKRLADQRMYEDKQRRGGSRRRATDVRTGVPAAQDAEGSATSLTPDETDPISWAQS